MNPLRLLHHALTNDEGADLAEYGMVLTLISIAGVIAMSVLGTQISTVYCSVAMTMGGSC